jgi:hypothetical protein
MVQLLPMTQFRMSQPSATVTFSISTLLATFTLLPILSNTTGTDIRVSPTQADNAFGLGAHAASRFAILFVISNSH